MAGLGMSCFPLAVETGRYSSTPYEERVCRLCDGGDVEDQSQFLFICPAFKDLRLQLLNHCNSVSHSFYQLSLESKVKFILSDQGIYVVNLLIKVYSYRQILMFS